MKKNFYLFVFSLFIFLTSLETQAKMFQADEFYLSNGLRVIVCENHKAPIAKMMLWYHVGSMDEPAGKGGLAHLLEHLMFRGTKNVPASDFNRIMHESGADFNAFTSRDMTVYHALVDLSRLELALALEADRMFNLQISEEAFSAEQKIVFEERQQRIENNPQSVFWEQTQKILWQDTPYEHPITGTPNEIQNLTKDDAVRFYKTYYTPNNAVLVITGDVTKEDIRPLAEKYFVFSKDQKTFSENNQAFSSNENGSYLIKRQLADVQIPKIVRSYIVPSMREDSKIAFALEIFSSYLGESQNSYFKRKLIKTNLVVDASSSVQTMSRGKGVFTVSLIPSDKEDFNEDIALLDQTLKNALHDFSIDDFEKEKKKILSWLVYVPDNPEDEAHIIGYLATLGFSLSEIEDYMKGIENARFEDLKKSVQNMLSNAKQVTSVLTPLRKAENDNQN